ncbi:MAG: glycosyltransferase [Thiovulaceae bacterium]|nr:glycosyltransferase [Sulfurimonadaceae bacterium]
MTINEPLATKRPLRVGFLSPTAIIDPASGASQSILTMLSSLVKHGVHSYALTGTCFDSVHGNEISKYLSDQGLKLSKTKIGALPLWNGIYQGINMHMIYMQSQRRMTVTALEESLFLDNAQDWLRQAKPDLIITFGGLLLDKAIMQTVQRMGIAVVFYLANGSYGKRSTFENVDLIITNSGGTAEFYRQKLKVNSINVGLFVDPSPMMVKSKEPKYVTFVNPQAEKGVTLFLKLVECAAKELPEMKFLVVESRAQLLPALQRMNLPESLLVNVTTLPRQNDMRKVYELTKILIMPSFWFEAAGRVLIEATSNAIPVIATNRGGIPETLAGAGILLDIPKECTTNYWHVPSKSELEPWWQSLKKLWEDKTYYEQQVQRAAEASKKHSLENKTNHLGAVLQKALSIRDERMQKRSK